MGDDKIKNILYNNAKQQAITICVVTIVYLHQTLPIQKQFQPLAEPIWLVSNNLFPAALNFLNSKAHYTGCQQNYPFSATHTQYVTYPRPQAHSQSYIKIWEESTDQANTTSNLSFHLATQ